MNESQAVDCFSALAHEVRLGIFRELVAGGNEGVSAGAIGQAVGAAPSKVSFHVAALERAGLATAEKVSRQVIYRIDFDQVAGLFSYLLTDCCKGDEKVLSCCGLSVGCKPKQ